MSGGAPSIRGIGTALPPQVFDQERTCEALIETLGLDRAAARRLRAVHGRARIRKRHSVLSNELHPLAIFGEGRDVPTSERMELYARHAPPLIVEACRRLFEDASVPRPDAVRHVLVASCTGFLAPGLDVHLTKALELRSDVGRTLIGFQGCQAGLTALRLAEAITRADPASSVLIACIELSSLHLQRGAGDDEALAGALFGDGAAAALVAGAAVPLAGPALEIERTATALHPDSATDMTWAVGDQGFELHLSRLVPRLVGHDFAPFVGAELGLADAAERAERFWAVHPGGAAILDALESSLGLPEDALEASREVLAACGNMSSATIWFVLDALRRREDLPPLGCALAFGPGLSLEAALLRRTAP